MCIRDRCTWYHLAECLILKESRCYAIHRQDLDAKRGHTSDIATVAQKLLHVSDVAKRQMLLEVVRLE